MRDSLSRRNFFAGVAASVLVLPARGESSGNLRVLEARAIKAGASEIGFDGVSPGPTLRYRQGDELAIRFVNKLDEPATIHWQGLRGENAMDGVASLTQPAVAPGESFDYRRKLVEPGLFGYRPGVLGRAPELMRRGLKGLLVVEEPEPLPADRELLLVLDDLDAGLAVNGKAAPLTLEERPGARLRLRLANLAVSRIMILTFEGVQPFVIAIDGQPCEAFEPVRKSIPVAPGARFELMFDMPKADGAAMRVFLRGAEGADANLLIATAKGRPTEGRGLIYSLVQNTALPPEIKLAEARKIDLLIEPPKDAVSGSSWTINGVRGGYSGKPLFQIKKNAAVTLGFVNHSDKPLAMHVHGHAVRLLHDLDDGWEPYWRNAVIVPAGKTKHVAFIAESLGKWAIHDDLLDHEAAGLATWFAVE